jgi:hypothetical protein
LPPGKTDVLKPGTPKPPTTTPPTTTPPGTGPGGGLTQPQQNAYDVLKSLFHTYDLDSLAPEILKMIQNGYDTSTIPTLLQETDAYKQRFAGNAIREKNGLAVLSPAEYLSVEASYQQVLRSYGLPSGFYDQHSDFTDWIGKNVSSVEIDKRAQIASDAVNTSDPFYVQSLQQMGFSQGDLISHVLDPDRALPLLQKQIQASQIGAEAMRQGLTYDSNRALQFASQGVTQNTAAQAYQQIGANAATAAQLSQIYGQQYGQADMEDELLGNSGAASQKRKLLAGQEQGAFQGQASSADKSFNVATRGEF